MRSIPHAIPPIPLPWRLKSGVRALAALAAVLVRKWLQPRGFPEIRVGRSHSTSGSPDSRRMAARAARCKLTAAAQSAPAGWIG
jgi:hypothetical protein